VAVIRGRNGREVVYYVHATWSFFPHLVFHNFSQCLQGITLLINGTRKNVELQNDAIPIFYFVRISPLDWLIVSQGNPS
jgi:hypothetical protein